MPLGGPDLCYAGTPTPAVSSSRCQIVLPPPPHPLLQLKLSLCFCVCMPRSLHPLFYFFLYHFHLLCRSKFIFSLLPNKPFVWRPTDKSSAWGLLDFFPALHSSEFTEKLSGHSPIPCSPIFMSLFSSPCSPHHRFMSGKRPEQQSHVCLFGQRGLVNCSHKADYKEGKTGI